MHHQWNVSAVSVINSQQNKVKHAPEGNINRRHGAGIFGDIVEAILVLSGTTCLLNCCMLTQLEMQYLIRVASQYYYEELFACAFIPQIYFIL